jgi:hypothetical protein
VIKTLAQVQKWGKLTLHYGQHDMYMRYDLARSKVQTRAGFMDTAGHIWTVIRERSASRLYHGQRSIPFFVAAGKPEFCAEAAFLGYF